MIIEKEKKVEIVENDNKSQEPKKTEENVTTDNSLSVKYIFKAFFIFIAILLLLLVVIFAIFTVYNYKHTNTIRQGIYIDNINVSGLTKQEAKSQIEDYYQNILSNDITLVTNDYTTYIKTSEIGLSFDIDSAVNYAYQIGKSNNIFQDNYQIFSSMLNGINIMPVASYDEQTLKNILNKLSSELPNAVIESGYYIDENNLIITKGSDGYIIDVDATSKNVKQKLENLSYLNEIIEIETIAQSPKEINLDTIYNDVHTEPVDAYYTTEPYAIYPSKDGLDFNISIEEAKEILKTADTECTIPLKKLHPNVTTNMIGKEAFPDLLASFSTRYAASAVNRTTNLRLAANKIDGYVLLPGETFSYNTVVGERTIAAGYKEAPVYENGGVTQGLGGGICQISTTLYNAVLFANLEIEELYNHMFVPSYAGAGRDATVVYGVMDFKFKNSRKNALKITCSVQNGIASFEIWGLKEETEYDVSVYANVTSRTSSYIKASTYRTLRLNGEVVNTEHIKNSTYKVH